jgi:hypothetical protein
MKKSITVALLAGLLFIQCTSCFAEEPKSVAKTALMMPVRVAGVFAALTVGTPIAIARIAHHQYKEYGDDAKDMDGDAGGGRVMSIPMSLGDGIAQGLYYGPRNAIVNFDKPFSKSAFSLEGSPNGKD